MLIRKTLEDIPYYSVINDALYDDRKKVYGEIQTPPYETKETKTGTFTMKYIGILHSKVALLQLPTNVL